MRPAAATGYQSSAVHSTRNEEAVSPIMQHQHVSRQTKDTEVPNAEVLKAEVLKPEVPTPEVTNPKVLEPEELSNETMSQGNRPEESSLMHPGNIPDCASDAPLPFQMPGLPSGSTTLPGTQQQMLLSVLFRAMQLVLQDATGTGSNSLNQRDMDLQLQHAAVAMRQEVSEATSKNPANYPLPKNEAIEKTVEKAPVASRSRAENTTPHRSVKPSAADASEPPTPCVVSTQTEALIKVGEVAETNPLYTTNQHPLEGQPTLQNEAANEILSLLCEDPSVATDHHGYPGHVHQVPPPQNVLLFHGKHASFPDDPKSHDAKTSTSSGYENDCRARAIINIEDPTDLEPEPTNFRFENSPNESITD